MSAEIRQLDDRHAAPEALATARVVSWRTWAAIGACALAIRLTALNRFSYWLDEMLEVYTIRSGWAKMLRNLQQQLLNPPLDYIFQKAFDILNPSDAARRILPALWGTGCVIVWGLLVSRRANPRVGVMSALCLAFAPFHVHYSQEVRPYSLGMFLTALTVLLIDRYLERPSGPRLASVLIAAVAVAYTMFLAALVLLLAGSTLVLDDALTGSASRRHAARRLLRWSPGLLLLIAAAYFPWLPMVWRSVAAPPFSTPPVFAVKRVSRLFSYFGFGFHDWYPLLWPGRAFIVLVAAGAILAVTRYRLRFLFVWAFLGSATIEVLEERHGVYDSIFHFLPAGIALAALATLPIGWLAERRPRAWLAPVALAFVLFLDARALRFYFQKGRVDWRPVAAFLRSQASDAPVFAAGQYTQLCLGYYVNGPDWLCCSPAGARSIIDVGPDAARLPQIWPPSGSAWLVTPVGATVAQLALLHETTATLFPTADGGVLVRQLAADAKAQAPR